MYGQLTGAGTIAKENVPQRETEMSAVLGKLFRILDVLDSSTGRLTDRVAPILSNNSPKEERINVDKPEFSSKLAQEINGAVARIEDINARINSLTSCIEI